MIVTIYDGDGIPVVNPIPDTPSPLWSATWSAGDLIGTFATASGTNAADWYPGGKITTTNVFAGQGVISSSASLQDRDVYATVRVPNGATGLAVTNALTFVYASTSTSSASCKFDLTVTGFNSSLGGSTTVYSSSGTVAGSADTATLIAVDKASLTDSTLFAYYVFKFTLYSKSDAFVYLMTGAINGQ